MSGAGTVNLTKDEEKEFREVSRSSERVNVSQPQLHHSLCALLSLVSPCSLPPFSQIFNLVDRDKGGSISKSELAQLMDTLAINASQQEIDLMIGEIDKVRLERSRGRSAATL